MRRRSTPLLAIAALSAMLGVSAFAAPNAGKGVRPKSTGSTGLPPGVISVGELVNLAARRVPERATVFVFLKPGSSLERQFAVDLKKQFPAAEIRLIHLATGTEPVARQYEVVETPTAVVMDRRGRVRGRGSDAAEIHKMIAAALTTPRIAWAEEGDPRYAEAVRVLGRPPGTGILRTMTLRPDYLDYINKLSRVAHFQDQYLDRRTKEIIASYVSSLNKCKY